MLEEREPFDINADWLKDISKNVKKDWMKFIKNKMKKNEDQTESLEKMQNDIKKLKFKLETANKELTAVVDGSTVRISTGLVYEVSLWGKYMSSPQARGDYVTRVIAIILHNTITKHFNDGEDGVVEEAEKVFNSGFYGRLYGFPSPLRDEEKVTAKFAVKGDRDKLERARKGRFLPDDICPRCRFRTLSKLGHLCETCYEMEKKCPECKKMYTGLHCQPCYVKEKKCKQCGGMYIGEVGNGICYGCEKHNWNEGFDSTTEHAYEVGHNDLNRKLDGKLTKKFEEVIREIMGDFDTDKWLCTKCETVRVEGSDKMDIDKTVKELLKPCPKCKAKGYLEHVVKGSYYH